MLIERETVQNMKMKFQQGAFLKYGKTEADPHQFSRRQFKFVPRRLHCCSFALGNFHSNSILSSSAY